MTKLIIEISVLLLIAFICAAGFSFQLKPFSFKLHDLWFGLGVVLIIIGVGIISSSSYHEGRKHSGYYDGYKQGMEDVIDRIKKLPEKK